MKLRVCLCALLTLAVATPSVAGVLETFNGGFVTLLANEWGNASRDPGPNIDYGRNDLTNPGDERYLDYWFKYSTPWEVGWGFKMPGMAGGTATVGCASPVPDGWSARYQTGTVQGGWRLYLYPSNRTTTCGTSFSLRGPGDPGDPTPFFIASDDRLLNPGIWHRLTQRIKINDPNVSNGIIQTWVNGVLVGDENNLRLRGNVGTNTARVDKLLVETFRGGSCDGVPNCGWMVPIETRIDFSDFYILDCLPNLTVGNESTAPTCDGGGGPIGQLPEHVCPSS